MHLIADSRMIWITVPDDQIQSVVRQISLLDVPGKNAKLVLHASGVYSLAALNPLHEAGYNIACAHPLLAINDPVTAREKLHSAWFAIEDTDDEKVEFSLVDFFNKCGNRTFKINPARKALYHTAACTLSNYLVTLMDVSQKIFEKSGMPGEIVHQAALPLLESVVDNLRNKDCRDALTGPIRRGDLHTIEMHLESLRAFIPEIAELYKLLGQRTMQMVNDYSLQEIFKATTAREPEE